MAARRRQSSALEALAKETVESESAVRLTGLRGAATSAIAAQLIRAHGQRPVLVVCPDSRATDHLVEDLRTTLGEREEGGRLRAFPRHDTLPFDRFSPQPFVLAQRMEVLHRWLSIDSRGAPPPPIVVAPWTALALRVPARATVRAHTHEIEVGKELDRDALIEGLTTAGYLRMSLVEEPGELAVRGGIVDLFPPHLRRPVRVEFWGTRSNRSAASTRRASAPRARPEPRSSRTSLRLRRESCCSPATRSSSDHQRSAPSRPSRVSRPPKSTNSSTRCFAAPSRPAPKC